ncbi:MAG: hypothetical protein ACRDIF_05650 [Actinomycetota bacterium]
MLARPVSSDPASGLIAAVHAVESSPRHRCCTTSGHGNARSDSGCGSISVAGRPVQAGLKEPIARRC